MSPPRLEVRRRAARWLLPAAALVVAPKCFVCLAGYLGLGALLGVKLGAGAREICGASGDVAPAVATTVAALLLVGIATGVVLFLRKRA
jgi:hypothetical protein